jgi:expansin (peptidoglycan-binding protein)
MQLSFISAILALSAAALVSAAPAKRKDSYSGTATWYTPATEGGNKAACGGETINDDSEIVALNQEQYGDMDKDSDWCGKEIEITGPKGTTKATIMDACPECSSGDLDLTPVLFKRVVGDKGQGVGDITWRVV